MSLSEPYDLKTQKQELTNFAPYNLQVPESLLKARAKCKNVHSQGRAVVLNRREITIENTIFTKDNTISLHVGA